jgi:hypothetical protein
MEEWGNNYRTEIDTIFFEQKTIEDIINLRFYLGEGIAQCSTCERGVSILVCHPHGIAETEHLQDHEHTTEATRGTRMLKEASNLTTAKSIQHNIYIFISIRIGISCVCRLAHCTTFAKCQG